MVCVPCGFPRKNGEVFKHSVKRIQINAVFNRIRDHIIHSIPFRGGGIYFQGRGVEKIGSQNSVIIFDLFVHQIARFSLMHGWGGGWGGERHTRIPYKKAGHIYHQQECQDLGQEDRLLSKIKASKRSLTLPKAT